MVDNNLMPDNPPQESDDVAVHDFDSQSLSPELTDILNKVDPKQRAVLIHSLRQIHRESFTGPLPHPEILQGYDKVQAGFAERILKMAEDEQAHTIRCEDKIVSSVTSQSTRGQWFGFILAILFLIVAGVLGFYGHDWLAGVIGGGTLISVVTVFLTNKSNTPNNDKPEEQ